MYNVHIFPSIAIVVNFCWLDVRLCRDHWKFLVSISMFYGVINFISTKLQGKPVYWFLPWDSILTLIVFLSLTSIFTAVWFIIVEISYKTKPIKHKLETQYTKAKA